MASYPNSQGFAFCRPMLHGRTLVKGVANLCAICLRTKSANSFGLGRASSLHTSKVTLSLPIATQFTLPVHHVPFPTHSLPPSRHTPSIDDLGGRRKRRSPLPLPICSIACVTHQPIFDQTKHGHCSWGHRSLFLSRTQHGEVCHHDGQAGESLL